MEEPPRIEGVISAKKISTKDAAKLTKRFLQDFSTYLHEDEDEQGFEELSNDTFAPEVEGVHIHIHDQLVTFVESHLGSSAGLKRIVEVPRPQAVIEGGIDSIIKGEEDKSPVKSEDGGTGDGGGGGANKNLTPKEMRKVEKAKAKELKRQEKAKAKELKRQEKEQKKLAKKEKKEKRRRSKGANDGDDEPETKRVKAEG